MNGDAINAIIKTAQEASDPAKRVVEVGGVSYSSEELRRIVPKEPLPEPLRIASLGGLVDYLKSDFDFEASEPDEMPMIHIVSPDRVALVGPMFGPARQRISLAVAEFHQEPHPWSRFQDHETAIIYLRTRFVNDENLKAVVAILGSVSDAEVRDYGDDGVTQQVNVKVGVSLKTTTPVPSPAILRPFRTFPEVSHQPASPFVVRLRRGDRETLPSVGLYECDGGAWRNEAVSLIREFLRKALGDGWPIVG